MASYPVEIRRCQHIKVNGTQCGSPALRDQQFCFFHQANRPVSVRCYVAGEVHSTGTFELPVLEDAHSIQAAVRQVSQFLLERAIDHKTAGLLLYALQIASSNLKQMQAEKPRPTQVVVEPERVAETPMGMTPWSASGEGHDAEEEAKVPADAPEARRRKTTDDDSPESWRECAASASHLADMRVWLQENSGSTYEELRTMVEEHVISWLQDIGEPVDFGLQAVEPGLPLGTIQACAGVSGYGIG